MEFCARKTKEALIVWIRAWFEKMDGTVTRSSAFPAARTVLFVPHCVFRRWEKTA